MTATAPDDIVETHAEGAANDREPLLVMAPLRAFLAEHGLDAPDDLEAVPFSEGHSNVTYGLSTGVVLRRPPRGPLPPSAHDVLREARLLSALEPADVRTPRVLAACEDPGVIGAPFYVMERKYGAVITDTIPEPLDTPEQRNAVADELIDSLVELHAVDWTRLGLEGFGKPTGYLERQLRRFNGLWEHNKTREIPEFEAVSAWLAENLPQSPPATIVHGDYRLGNTMVAAEPPARLIAIFDWEMATIGDPLADLGYMMLHWRQAGDADDSRLTCRASRCATASRPARRWSPATSSAPGVRCTPWTGTWPWPCGRPWPSWRATTSGPCPDRPMTRTSRASATESSSWPTGRSRSRATASSRGADAP